MTGTSGPRFDPRQLAALQWAFHRGSADASCALAKWVGRPSIVEVDSLERLPLAEASGLLATPDEPICFCAVQMHGLLSGEMILAFDDASGLALADMLLEKPPGTTHQWTEMATSIALETTNILCCAYLNSLLRSFSGTSDTSELLPSPPTFSRDYAESLLEFVLMGQAVVSNEAFVARTRFEIDATPVNWTLLFVPDAPSMSHLPELLPTSPAER